MRGRDLARHRRLRPLELVTDEIGMLYLATDLTDGEAAPDATEDLRRPTVPFAEAVAMIDRGELTRRDEPAGDRAGRTAAGGGRGRDR